MLIDNKKIIQTDNKFDADVSNERYSNHLFVRLVATKKKFTNVDFKYSFFDACYLRDCQFDSCDFIGCRFSGTSFHGSSFLGCKFDYASFERTIIDSDILDTGCPGHENLKMRFARSLRMNYQQLGDALSANKAMGVELQASEIHLFKAWNSNETYYRKKYAGWKRIKSFVEWIKFKALDLIWGNGESAYKLIRAALFVLVLISLYDVVMFKNPQALNSYKQALFDSPQILLGTLSPEYYSSASLTVILILRLVLFGFFMSILIKRFNRR
jgi:hypothetical protein